MLQSMFGFVDQSLSIRDIASDLGASEASVRNWIKTGYLRLDERKQITHESYVHFKSEIVGSKKLNKRANKQFLTLPLRRNDIKSYGPTSICPSINYEKSLTESHKNKEGIFYTPDNLADQFFADLPSDRQNLTFLDPCCGTGNFLLAAIRNGFSPQNVFGFDTDSHAIEITKQRLLKYPEFELENVKRGDFLRPTCDKIGHGHRFDVIMTNPPWGKKLPKTERETIGNSLGAGKSIDTCSLFFLKSLKHLKLGGYCGFLLPDSFFNIGTFEAARRQVLSLEIIKISDFGKAFSGILTNAVGIFVRNNPAERCNAVDCQEFGAAAPYPRRQSQFSLNPSAIFNFRCSDEQAEAIDHVLSISHTTLRGRAQWGLGIVTGNNARFIRDRPLKGHMPVWKGSDVVNGALKAPTNFIPDDLTLYQQVAPLQIYDAPEKLIYRFISNRLAFFHDREQRRILNSANVMIPEIQFNFGQEYLGNYLNSGVINWLFRSIFSTHKVLRRDLECLPLFLDFMESGDAFNEKDLCHYLGIREADNGAFRIA